LPLCAYTHRSHLPTRVDVLHVGSHLLEPPVQPVYLARLALDVVRPAPDLALAALHQRSLLLQLAVQKRQRLGEALVVGVRVEDVHLWQSPGVGGAVWARLGWVAVHLGAAGSTVDQ
jgi:hypothetical protein